MDSLEKVEILQYSESRETTWQIGLVEFLPSHIADRCKSRVSKLPCYRECQSKRLRAFSASIIDLEYCWRADAMWRGCVVEQERGGRT